ncbi:hypothetical protein [Microbacterium proteolyticum]|uniref:hypothetical protein n=1 Tax=Microbacterium proteolyticum TaxID=1572644 RepID=UPI001FACDEEE|nr:hypothetical protein [Microbacterium proteolyticum]MCI9858739.1 hypothetical protein [Microbacterium proteolyticum]
MLLPDEALLALPSRTADLDDDFAEGFPGPSRWISSYLPHWTDAERAAARWNDETDGVRLRIDQDQRDWRPEDAPLRVSNLQTGLFAGEKGSHRGMHRHRDDLTVRTEVPTSLLFIPTRGRVDVTLSATRDSGCMVAAWLVGTEHLSPRDAGEICLFEIDADAVTDTETRARSGIKAHHDPRLATDMAEVSLPFDASRPHTWTAVWGDGETIIGCEGVVVRRIAQAPDYPLALMIDIFEVDAAVGPYPKSFVVHRVRGWNG